MSEIRHPGMNDDSMGLGFGPDPEPVDRDNSTPASGGHITLTQEQFQTLLNRFSQPAIENDYAAALTGQEPEQIATPEIDLSQLPNPVQDPDGFRQGLGAVLTQGAQQLAAQAAQTTQRINAVNQAYDQAWALMKERYPDIAKHDDIVQAAASREWNDLQARGIDVPAALMHNMEAAVDAVAARAQDTINRVRGLQEGTAGEEGYRTDMLDGRGPAPGAPKSRTPSQTSFVDDLKKLQREMGIY